MHFPFFDLIQNSPSLQSTDVLQSKPEKIFRMSVLNVLGSWQTINYRWNFQLIILHRHKG